MSDFDSPWKDALEHFWPEFLAFFFPHIHSDVDWSRGYQSLDKELEQILSKTEIGKRLADKLFQVWRQNGEETWVLIHVEVQAQRDVDFPQRMFVYHYRIFERYERQVVSLAVLADESSNWRPDRYVSELWGCESSLRFPTVKLLDYADDIESLESNPNPFGLLVSAHLQTQATRSVDESRFAAKIRLVKLLLDRGMSIEQVRHLFRFIDILLYLPKELEERFDNELYEYQKEKKMTYMTRWELKAMEKGREEAQRELLLNWIASGLRDDYPDFVDEIMAKVEQIRDVDQLQDIFKHIWKSESIESIRELMPAE